MNDGIVSQLSSKAVIEHYEELRRDVLSNANDGSLGLALFLNHGMVAWMRALSKYRPAEPTQLLSEEKLALSLGWDLRTELTTILANILLSHQQEAIAPC